jgi:hypothetical protein
MAQNVISEESPTAGHVYSGLTTRTINKHDEY